MTFTRTPLSPANYLVNCVAGQIDDNAYAIAKAFAGPSHCTAAIAVRVWRRRRLLPGSISGILFRAA
jgi:hypothetical protein